MLAFTLPESPRLSRPVQPRPMSEHVITVTRMTRSIEVDESLSTRRKTRLLELLVQLTSELQKEITP